VVLPDNSVVVTWTHGNNAVIFQRISADGALLWNDGILIEDAGASLVSPQPTTTAEGDVLIQWIRQTGSPPYYNSELYLQTYDLGGSPQWSEPTVAAGPVVFPMGNWSQQSVAEAGGGSFSAWTEMTGNVQNAVVQHITGNGELSWAGGVDLSTNSNNFRISPILTIAEETQELIAVWREANGGQSQHGVFAQRLDSNGNRLWGSNGSTVAALNSSYDYLDLSVAGFGEEMISVYIQLSANMNGDIYANRLDSEGNSVWADGMATVTNSGSPKSDMMIGKGPNCLFIAYTEGGTVNAHCLRDDGTLGAPDLSGGPGDVLLVPSEYAVIQDAIDAAEDGDTVLVSPGTYQENINYSGKNIVIGSYAIVYGSAETFINQTIIDGGGNGSVVTVNSGEDSTAVLDGFTITGGTSEYGGGIYIDSVNSTLKNLVVIGNTANSNGGGIHVAGSGWTSMSSPRLENLIIMGNSANSGGGISCWIYSSPSLENVTIRGNTAESYGGGILSWESNPSLENVTISGNTAGSSGGGGIYSYSSGISLGNVNISDNSTSGPGGGIYYNQSNSNLTNVTISGNSATGEDGFGGAIYHTTVSYSTLLNCILWNNSPQEIYFSGEIEWNSGSSTAAYCDIQDGEDGIITNNNGTVTWEEGNIDTNPLFCNPDSGDFTLAENSPCVSSGENGANMGALDVGCEAILSIEKDVLPLQFVLYQNYPNPFNPVTTLRYNLPEDAMVNLTIYDMMGRQVSTLVSSEQSAGYKSVQWNAVNDAGAPVSAGLYLYRIRTGKFVKTHKMVLLK
jgi:predicted outer membrane repeat protein